MGRNRGPRSGARTGADRKIPQREFYWSLSIESVEYTNMPARPAQTGSRSAFSSTYELVQLSRGISITDGLYL